MGGLAALWGHLTRPHVFGGALALSRSLCFGDRRQLELASQAQPPAHTRVYVDAGAREAGGSVAQNSEHLAAFLRERGWGEAELKSWVDPEGEHREGDWRRRLPEALGFVLAPRARPNVGAGPMTPEEAQGGAAA